MKFKDIEKTEEGDNTLPWPPKLSAPKPLSVKVLNNGHKYICNKYGVPDLFKNEKVEENV